MKFRDPIVTICLTLGLAISLLAGASQPLTAQSGDTALRAAARQAAGELSSAYLQERGPLAMKAGLSLLGVENLSDGAARKQLGEAVAAYMEEALTQSAVFYLVDRRQLQALLREVELSLSGLFDGEVPDMSALRSADVLLAGRVVEAGSGYRVLFSLVEVASGQIVATAAFEIAAADLDSAATELAYRYVAANGIGLSAGSLLLPFTNNLYNKGLRLLVQLGAAYRPERD
ncbi:MAG: hypothetical protein A2087_11420 [Spirochaetes bacterium GWD1_61_31]|nr:MAG: hypothetical protein A2Y37_14650 [Spirochaetes bacterium GWB1_60_80]OHD29303.1 MAG: hypothetical protein A2004_08150 [Spirochaetes bacterium GWC1_61_12]OHD35811.1 MAG: hypothetical protein A2087_11420 [Spirochaetes bacterium GWD1_61_31]OHD46752.1 MAG: hypothetical protein A2Y35_10590 [Spirochaetes bacterium GWE1_60_18]OHD61204.1 MAG: hypothetical protein A2Y32_12885 [Spirochaetes bacterium GWF1_60_12]HAP43038.1 hypothetical protein [Spirochaetaceae bacterium]